MDLLLPCGRARKRANEGWPLPAGCGSGRARACLPLAKAARVGDVMTAKGSWVEGGLWAGCEP